MKADLESLFDISTCTCLKPQFGCKIESLEPESLKIQLKKCVCEEKIPESEIDFYLDQIGSHEMHISNSVDLIGTKLIAKRAKRKESKRKREELLNFKKDQTNNIQNQTLKGEHVSVVTPDSPEFQTESVTEMESHEESDGEISSEKESAHQSQNRNEYPLTIAAATRFGIGKRALCEVGNAMLKDLGIWQPEITLRPSKISRLFKKYGSQLAENNRQGFTCLMFDGRKDDTLTVSISKNHSSQLIREVIKEEHIVLIEEPGGLYRDHITPKSGKGVDIAQDLYKYLQVNGSEQTLQVIGADGTAVNTGRDNGAIALLEKRIGRPLQWVICMLHLNELPLRHLFKHLDGATTGPNTYKGPIGSAIVNDLRFLPVISFKKVSGRVLKLPAHVISGFTGDQKYFYELCRAVQKGVVSPSLETRSPGKICESRWLTKANRILRLYVATDEPSENLKR